MNQTVNCDLQEPDTDVLIIGGGPVGHGLAVELGQRRQRCIVVEQHEQPSPIPKGQNLTQRTMEHFHFWGVESALRAARTIPPEYGIGGLTTYGTLLSDYSYDWFQRELVKPFYFTDNERLPQYETERVLRQRVSELPTISTLYGWTMTAIVQSKAGPSVELTHRHSGTKKSLTASYLVGCDGSHSTVRDLSGITQTLSDHNKLMVLLVFRSHELHELLKRYPGKSFFSILHPDLHGYWRFFGRVDLGSTWFFHAPVPADTTKDTLDVHACLTEAVGAEFSFEVLHIGFWDLRIAAADTYRNDGVFIAGDAAHSHPPYGAFGINTGFEDARNLGWKLAAVLEGWADNSLLDSYHEERRPVFVSTAGEFIENQLVRDANFLSTFHPEQDRAAFEHEWQKRAAGTGDDINSFEPNYRGSSIVWGPDGATCNAIGPHSFRARAGHHLAPQMLSTGENVYTQLGNGFTLLAFGAEAAIIDSFKSAAARLNIPLSIVTDRPTVDSEKYGQRLILVRPDQFVAWTDDDIHDSPVKILTRVAGR